MGIGDLFKSFFTRSSDDKWLNAPPLQSFGASGLPRSVEEDLLRKKMMSPGPDEDLVFRGGDQHAAHGMRQFERDILHEMDAMMKGIFGGLDERLSRGFDLGQERPEVPVFSKVDGDANINGRNTESLRDKMFEHGGNSPGDFSSWDPIRPDSGAEALSFGFRSPFFFRDFWKGPFVDPLPHPFLEPLQKPVEDTDLDQEIESGQHSVRDLLKHGDEVFGHEQGRSDITPRDFTSLFKYSTVTKKFNADGSVETTVTKRDSDGNEETTTSRCLDDKVHTIIYRKDKHGSEEKTENLVNMDESELPKFEERWKSTGTDRRQGPRDQVLSHYHDGSPESFRNWKDYVSTWWSSKL